MDSLEPIELRSEVPSTNAEMKRRGRVGAPHGAALRALVQTAGRGQRSHDWASPEGGLYLSVLIRPEVPGEALPALPVACALGALGALREVGCPRARLKWPNDIVVGNHKLAGILTELVATGEDVFAVCGIGVNMEAPVVSTRSGSIAALHPTGLLDELAPGMTPPSLEDLAELVRKRILDAASDWEAAYGKTVAYRGSGRPGVRVPGYDIARWAEDPVRGGAEGPLAPLLAPYNACLAFVGQRVRVYAIDGEERAQGTFLGVDGYGRALVAQRDGSVAGYDAADVSIRPLSLMGE